MLIWKVHVDQDGVFGSFSSYHVQASDAAEASNLGLRLAADDEAESPYVRSVELICRVDKPTRKVKAA